METPQKTIKILFVCLGNICRSPSAEGIMRKLVDEAGLSKSILIDSAGLISIHQGEKADSRMREHARRRNYSLDSISRPVTDEDFETFDLILGMDYENIRQLNFRATKEEQRTKVITMCSFAQEMQYAEVPDPYYGGDAGFELVLDILEDACAGLLINLKTQLNK